MWYLLSKPYLFLFATVISLMLYLPAPVLAQSATSTPAPTVNPTVTPATAGSMTTVAPATLTIKCTVNVLRLNLRSGPGTEYRPLSQMSENTSFTATARLADSSWLYGTTPEQQGWTSTRFLDCLDVVNILPIDEQFTPATVSLVATRTISLTATTVSSASDGTSQPVVPLANVTPTAVNTSTSSVASGSTNSAGAPSVTLIEPLGAQLYGRQHFRWQSSTSLQPNQGYELIFWEEGQDPLANGFALSAARPEAELNVDLEKVAVLVPRLQSGKEYQWGVVLVQMRPYRRLQFLGGSSRFLLAPGSAGGTASDTDSGQSPKAPPKAPPK